MTNRLINKNNNILKKTNKQAKQNKNKQKKKVLQDFSDSNSSNKIL